MRKKQLLCTTVVLVLVFLMPLVVFAGSRITSGWLPDQGMESLRVSSSWVYVTMGFMFTPLVYDQLWWMGPGPDYEPQPWLATSWETEDGKTWRFHLRKDSRFHDGKPVTAADVAFTMEYLPKTTPAFQWHGTVIEPGSAKVIDTYTVEFTLPTALGGKYPAAFWIPILPKHLFEPYKDKLKEFPNERAIGSGPFKLKEFKPGESMWFVANEDYWGDIPKVDEVVFRTYGSVDVMALALKSGEIQMFGYGGTTPAVAERLKGVKGIKIIVSPTPRVCLFSFNLHRKGPIRELNVRKAIMHAVNKKRIIDVVYRGQAQLLDSFIYPEMAEYNPNLPQYDYDPKKAANILEAAGYTDSDGDGLRNDPKTGKALSFELLVSNSNLDLVKAVQMVSEQLKEIGIKIVLKALDGSTASALIYKPNESTWDIGASWQEPGPYGDWAWEKARSWEGGGAGWNSAYYNNPKFDQMLDQMLAERDLDKRKELVFAMQQTIAEDLPYGYLWRPQTFDPIRTDKFEGFMPSMGGVATWFNPWTYFNVKPK
ncbi:MAG: ABC transporter substrate-binding protein [Deltaproteobacteria bacterium]|nr:ABC transporter substrate-binding protein [Deltaproteobacteria bacterium]